MIKSFEARQVSVTHADSSKRLLHASGHPHAEELRQMYSWLRPGLVVPVHGERKHMLRNAQIAEGAGVPSKLVGENGDVFDLLKRRKQAAKVPAGRVWFDEDANKLRPVKP